MIKPRIFVSYTTKNPYINRELLSWIASLLSSYGIPFIDWIHNNSINPQARVEWELENSDILLLLDSSSIESSAWVKWEVQQALALQIPVLAVKLDASVSHQRLCEAIHALFNSSPSHPSGDRNCSGQIPPSK